MSVCRLALSRIGQDPQITSISPPDGTVEADLCAQFLPLVLAKTYAARDWSFLTVKDKLAEVANEKPHPPFLFIYMYPADAEKINFVFTPDLGDYPVRFRVEANRAGDRFICTNAPKAWVEYQALPNSVKTLPPWFVDTVAWGLAAELAGAIVKGTTGSQLVLNATQMYEAGLVRASERDAQQNRDYINNFISDFERARF